MIEYVACYQQFDSEGLDTALMLARLDETACKTGPVQAEVANIVGRKISLDAIPDEYSVCP